jgi:hypothetical protein
MVHSIPEVFMFKQVSRLGFSLLEPLPVLIGTVGMRSFVPLTVTGIAQVLHLIPSAQKRPLLPQIRTRYSTGISISLSPVFVK